MIDNNYVGGGGGGGGKRKKYISPRGVYPFSLHVWQGKRKKYTSL